MGKDKLKILVIGSGGREHSLVWKIAKSKKVKKIYCSPGNAGTSEYAQNIQINASDIKSLLRFAKKEKIDLTFVGPEAPLIAGIVDLFKKNNMEIIGPSKNAARIEGSKVFAKKMMAKYRIPTAVFKVFNDYKKAILYAKSSKYPLVIKADGQCLGKGVIVAQNFIEAQNFLRDLLLNKTFGLQGSKVIIEECLIGQEVSFMVATDGIAFVSLLTSQDHKRVNDIDRGPNTGGMGAYGPVPFVDKKLFKIIEDNIVKKILLALKSEGSLYKGILYPGLILTKDGPKVLEFNCRFGDPETQPILSLLKTDIVDIFQAIIEEKVNILRLSWLKEYAVCVVLTSKGYPGNYEKGYPITFARAALAKSVTVFHSGTKKIEGKIVSSGGRVLGITGRGKTLREAIKAVYKAIGNDGVHFSGMHYRKDIGQKGLNKKLW